MKWHIIYGLTYQKKNLWTLFLFSSTEFSGPSVSCSTNNFPWLTIAVVLPIFGGYTITPHIKCTISQCH
jgi:hypothetical protein